MSNSRNKKVRLDISALTLETLQPLSDTMFKKYSNSDQRRLSFNSLMKTISVTDPKDFVVSKPSELENKKAIEAKGSEAKLKILLGGWLFEYFSTPKGYWSKSQTRELLEKHLGISPENCKRSDCLYYINEFFYYLKNQIEEKTILNLKIMTKDKKTLTCYWQKKQALLDEVAYQLYLLKLQILEEVSKQVKAPAELHATRYHMDNAQKEYKDARSKRYNIWQSKDLRDSQLKMLEFLNTSVDLAYPKPDKNSQPLQDEKFLRDSIATFFALETYYAQWLPANGSWVNSGSEFHKYCLNKLLNLKDVAEISQEDRIKRLDKCLEYVASIPELFSDFYKNNITAWSKQKLDLEKELENLKREIVRIYKKEKKNDHQQSYKGQAIAATATTGIKGVVTYAGTMFAGPLGGMAAYLGSNLIMALVEKFSSTIGDKVADAFESDDSVELKIQKSMMMMKDEEYQELRRFVNTLLTLPGKAGLGKQEASRIRNVYGLDENQLLPKKSQKATLFDKRGETYLKRNAANEEPKVTFNFQN